MNRFALYRALASAPLKPGEPRYLVLFITSRCNARCRMCFNHENLARNGEGDLTLAELDRIAEQWPGLTQLTLSGGEPFLRDDLVEVVEVFVRRAGAKQVSIPTNAILTERVASATAEMLKRLPGLPLNLYLSVDEIGETHDQIRQVPGAFAAVMKTAKRLGELRSRHRALRVGATVVLMNQNQERIIKILSELKRRFPWDRLQVELVRGRPAEPGSNQVKLEHYEAAAQWLDEHGPRGAGFFGLLHHRVAGRMRRTLIQTLRQDRQVVPCPAGQELVVVEADGTVRPCEVLHTLFSEQLAEQGLTDPALGRLREQDYRIQKILRFSHSRRLRQWIVQNRCHCSYECALYGALVFHPTRWFSLLFPDSRPPESRP